jgi:subtilisin family serine protease
VRLILAVTAAAVLAPVAGLLPTADAADAAPQRVTAVARDAGGHLTFRTEHLRGWSAARSRARHLTQDPAVIAASVDHVVHVAGTPDPRQDQQWGLNALQADTVWAAGDASGQVVAVIDTGVDASHPDLAGVVRVGRDFVQTGDARYDPNGHGTHVAGVVAAVGGNGIGGAGLAQGAQILPVRVMDSTGSGYDSDAARGLVWAADHGATVANMSLGGPDRSAVLDSAISYALGKGVTIVAAAGNAGLDGDPTLWPAADPGVIAVGAVDAYGVRPGWSSTGSHLAVVAPGVSILSTVPGGGYQSWSGTSMAAPFVSAAAALLKHRSVLGPAAVRTQLMATAVDLGPLGFDPQYGAGRIDLVAAEGLSLLPVVPDPVPTTEPVVAMPVDSPSVEPSPEPVTVTPSPTAEPSVEPTPAELAVPVLTARMSVSRSRIPYAGTVTIAARTLADGVVTGGLPVRLERLVGSSWVMTRTSTTGPDGLASWTLRPDRTYDYRVTGGDWAPPVARVSVVPLVSMSRYLSGRVLPSTATTVRLQRWRSTGWVTVAYAVSRTDGTFRFGTRVASGSTVRAVAAGVASSPTRV